MVGDAVGNHHIEHLGGSGATGDAGVDHQRGVEIVDEGESGESGVDLADARLDSNHLMALDAAEVESGLVDGDGGMVVDEREQEVELLAHGGYNGDFHDSGVLTGG